MITMLNKRVTQATLVSVVFRCRSAFWLSLAVIVFTLAGSLSAAPVVTRLADKGKALYPIVVAQAAEAGTSQVATNLATMLTRISGAPFEIVQGDGAVGIVVGTVKDFPDLALSAKLDPTDPMRREEYMLVSHAKGLLILGTTKIGIENGIWDLLNRVGYRQFFPGPVWEIVPL